MQRAAEGLTLALTRETCSSGVAGASSGTCEACGAIALFNEIHCSPSRSGIVH